MEGQTGQQTQKGNREGREEHQRGDPELRSDPVRTRRQPSIHPSFWRGKPGVREPKKRFHEPGSGMIILPTDLRAAYPVLAAGKIARGGPYGNFLPDSPSEIRGFESGSSEQRLRGNDAIVESMEKSYDFPTLPTMAWIPLRGIHIPTKPTSILLYHSQTSKTRNLKQKESTKGLTMPNKTC